MPQFANPTWFTPQQYMEARQYYWQKLEREKNLVLEEIPEEKRISYFNRPGKQDYKCQYDLMFHVEHGWDQKMWRSDRHNPRIIEEAIFKEEDARTVPVLTSSNYGHRKTNLEGKPLCSHKRTHLTHEFYRINDPNMKPNHGLPRTNSVIL